MVSGPLHTLTNYKELQRAFAHADYYLPIITLLEIKTGIFKICIRSFKNSNKKSLHVKI